jgi:hypothetical protein
MRPNTEPTTIPAILPLLSQGPGSTFGCAVAVGYAVVDVVDIAVDFVVLVGVGDVEVVVLVVIDNSSLLVGVSTGSAVVDEAGSGGGGAEEVSMLRDDVATELDGSAVTKAIEVRNLMDVTKGGGSVSS